MWVFTTQGFYSINRTPDGERLQLRARVREDIDKFREKYCPSLGETIELGGTDYRYRAEASERALAAAMVLVVTDVNYQDFKNAVEDRRLGRHNAYLGVWKILRQYLELVEEADRDD